MKWHRIEPQHIPKACLPEQAGGTAPDKA